MLLKVSANMPKSIEELTGEVTKAVTKILVNKLSPEEMEEFISILQQEEVHINL